MWLEVNIMIQLLPVELIEETKIVFAFFFNWENTFRWNDNIRLTVTTKDTWPGFSLIKPFSCFLTDHHPLGILAVAIYQHSMDLYNCDNATMTKQQKFAWETGNLSVGRQSEYGTNAA